VGASDDNRASISLCSLVKMSQIRKSDYDFKYNYIKLLLFVKNNMSALKKLLKNGKKAGGKAADRRGTNTRR